MASNATTLSIGLQFDTASFTRDLRAATAAMTTFQKAAKQTDGLLSSLAQSFSNAGDMANRMVMAGEKMTDLKRKLGAITSSINNTNKAFTGGAARVENYDETFEYLRGTALKTGSSFDDLAKSYAQLAPAAVSTGIAVEDVRRAIEGTIGAGQFMGASGEEMQGVFTAIRQAVGKGALELEDLGGQIGESLPNAMLIMSNGLTRLVRGDNQLAASLGLVGTQAEVTTAKLNQMITDGLISGNLFLRAWQQGTAEFAKFSELSSTTVSGQMNNLATIANTNIGGFMRDSGINLMLAAVLDSFNRWFDKLTLITAERAAEIGKQLFSGLEKYILAIADSFDDAFVLDQTVINTVMEALSLLGAGFSTLLDILPAEAVQLGIIGYLLLGRLGLKSIQAAVLAAVAAGTAVTKLLRNMAEDPFAEDVIGRNLYDTMGGRQELSKGANYGSRLLDIDEATATALLDPSLDAKRRDDMIQREWEALALDQARVAQLKKQYDQIIRSKPTSYENVPEYNTTLVGINSEIGQLESDIERKGNALTKIGEINAIGLARGFDQKDALENFVAALLKPYTDANKENTDRQANGTTFRDRFAAAFAEVTNTMSAFSTMDKDVKNNERVGKGRQSKDDAKPQTTRPPQLGSGSEMDNLRARRDALLPQIAAYEQPTYLSELADTETKQRQLALLQAQHQTRQQGLSSVVNDELTLEREKLAAQQARLDLIFQEKGLRDSMVANEVARLGTQTSQNTLQAGMMMTDQWRGAQYEADKSAVDVQMARLYYEYSLTAEQRLQLVRADGLRQFTDGFSGLISGVLSGQTGIIEGVRSMFANMTKYMLDFFAKWIAQQLMMKAITGIGSLLGFGGSSDPLSGWQAQAQAGGDAVMALYAPTAHSGGVLGSSRLATTLVSPSVFDGAPKLHSGGLLRGEVPIIAKRGEGVFTPEQMDNADNLLTSALTSGNTSPSIHQEVTVNVSGGAGTSEQNTDLADKIGRQVKAELRGLMTEEMRQQMRPGGLLRGGY
ncbi:tape measure protein [Azospirillum argentinense]